MKRRVGNLDGEHPAYANVECRMTREEYVAWYVPAATEWLRLNPGGIPTVDRINVPGHYENGNLKISSLSVNSTHKPKNKNVYAPDGQAWCNKCKAYLPVGKFNKAKNRFNGLKNVCRHHGRLMEIARYARLIEKLKAELRDEVNLESETLVSETP